MEKGAWLAERASCMVFVLVQVGIPGPDRTLLETGFCSSYLLLGLTRAGIAKACLLSNSVRNSATRILFAILCLLVLDLVGRDTCARPASPSGPLHHA